MIKLFIFCTSINTVVFPGTKFANKNSNINLFGEIVNNWIVYGIIYYLFSYMNSLNPLLFFNMRKLCFKYSIRKDLLY